MIIQKLIFEKYFANFVVSTLLSENSKGTKLKKREKDKNINKTSEESSSSTSGKSNIKNMLLNMGKDCGKSLKRTKDNSGKMNELHTIHNRHRI